MNKFYLTIKDFVKLSLMNVPIFIDFKYKNSNFYEGYYSQKIRELLWEKSVGCISFKGTQLSELIEIEEIDEHTLIQNLKTINGDLVSCYVEEEKYLSLVKRKIIGYFCPVRTDEGIILILSENKDEIKVSSIAESFFNFLENSFYMFNKIKLGNYKIIDDSFEGCVNLFELLHLKGFDFSYELIGKDKVKYEDFLVNFKNDFITDSIEENNIDKIFFKINKLGLNSLNEKEKNTLENYRNSLL